MTMPTDPPATPPPAPPTLPTPTPSTPPPTGTPPADSGEGGQSDERQAELDRVAAKTRAEAERKHNQAVADQLGMTVEEAAAKLKAANDAELASMSEAERMKAEAAQATEQATRLAESARAAEVKANLTAALLAPPPEGSDAASLNPANLDVILDIGSVMELAKSDDPEAITKAVAKAREMVPALFNPGDGTGAAKHVTPPPPARRGGERQPAPTVKSEVDEAFEQWKSRNSATQI